MKRKMRIELIETPAGNEGRHHLEMLALNPDCPVYAELRIGHVPEVGEEFVLETCWPLQKDGLVAATQDDYKKYGEGSAFGTFKRVA